MSKGYARPGVTHGIQRRSRAYSRGSRRTARIRQHELRRENDKRLVTTGLWVAATGIVAPWLESIGAALVLFGIAGLLIKLA